MNFHVVNLGGWGEGKRNPDALLSLLNRANQPYTNFCLWILGEEAYHSTHLVLSSLRPEIQAKVRIYDVKNILTDFVNVQWRMGFIKHSLFNHIRKIETEEWNLFYYLSQILLVYITLLHNGKTVSAREMVTGKELFSLWISYVYGGVILDAGCAASESGWNPEFLVNCTKSTFRKKAKFMCPYVTAKGILSDKFVSSLITKWPGAVNPGEESILLMDPLLISIPREIAERRGLLPSSFEHPIRLSVPYLDNWIHSSPRYSSIALFSLQFYVKYLFFPYYFLHSRYRLSSPILSGAFNTQSANLSINAIMAGYYLAAARGEEALHDKVPKIPRDIGAIPKKFDDLFRFIFWTNQLPNGTIIIDANIIKTSNPNPGWKIPLNDEQSVCAMERFELLKRVVVPLCPRLKMDPYFWITSVH